MKRITIDYLPKRGLCRFSGDYFNEVREFFSVKNEGAFFMRKKGMGFVADRKYFITPTGMFEPGMFFDVCRFINATFNDVKISISDDLGTVVKPTLKVPDVYDNLTHKLRDFQYETIKQSLSFGRGIIKIGTGGGKTLTAAGLISSIYRVNKNLKCLIIVPDLSLVNQTNKDFIEYKVPFTVTRWTGDLIPDLSANVIVANMSILLNRIDENKWINDIDLLIVDECFRWNTQILTINGHKNISDINVGDIVLSRNVQNNLEWKPVVKLYKNLHKSASFSYFLHIQLENDIYIECTPNHKIYTSNGVKEAQYLTIDDDIIFINSFQFMTSAYRYYYEIAKKLQYLWRRGKVLIKTCKTFT